MSPFHEIMRISLTSIPLSQVHSKCKSGRYTTLRLPPNFIHRSPQTLIWGLVIGRTVSIRIRLDCVRSGGSTPPLDPPVLAQQEPFACA